MDEGLDSVLASPPLPYSAWSLSPEAMRTVAGEIREHAAHSVVELGCGASTIGIGRILRRQGGSLTALEHDPDWAELVRTRLHGEGLGAGVRILPAPLRAHPLAAEGARWYSPGAIAGLPAQIDFLLVDGPPGNEAGIELSRYPALPALAERLVPGAVVVLDDAVRPGEREVLARWQASYPISFEPAVDGRLAIGAYSPGSPPGRSAESSSSS